VLCGCEAEYEVLAEHGAGSGQHEDKQSQLHPTLPAQEWTNRTLIGHEPLICSKMCFAKTELVQ